MKGNGLDSDSYVGGITGKNQGTITACHSSATVKGINVGGVVGYNAEGGVSACYSTGNVTAIKNSIASYSYAGGVVGQNDYLANLIACYATSDVIGNGNYAGGVVGYNAQGRVSACYWSGKAPEGIGLDMSDGGDATEVEDNWTEAMNAMNEELTSAGIDWLYATGSDGVPLTLQRQN